MVNQEIVIIVDRSGSMAGKEADTIGGINTMIKTLKSENENTNNITISVKFFDNEEFIKVRRMNLEKIYDFKISDLKPRGSTALYDAVGNTLQFFNANKGELKFDLCSVYVATDGFENSSKKFNSDSLKCLIEESKSNNINMFYLGANQDAILEAGKIGIPVEQAINYTEDSSSVEAVYRNAARTAKRSRTGEFNGFTQVERTESCRRS